MKIHTVKEGESLRDIALAYGVKEEWLREHNALLRGEPRVGEELLVLIPTRTYTPKSRDSAQSVMVRFGVSEGELYKNNPTLKGGKLPTSLALKYRPHPYGAAATLGYYYEGCDHARLASALPYLTYVTFASAALTDGGIKELFGVDEAMEMAKKGGAVCTVKIYDKRSNKENSEKWIEPLVKFAKDRGYDGITLELSASGNDEDRIAALLVELRRAMIGNDLILIGEVEKDGVSLVDYADGCVISPGEGIALGDFCSRLSDFAESSESIKTLVELPVFATSSGEFISIEEAIATLRRTGESARREETGERLTFTDKRLGDLTYPSLRYIKAVLDRVNEYGYMGVSFDIMRLPRAYLYLFGSLFKTLKSYSSLGGM